MTRTLAPFALCAVLSAGCHETMRVRTPSNGGPSIIESGTCEERPPTSSETCQEHEQPDAKMTAVAVGAILGLVVLGAFTVNYLDNHCPIC